ncbi:hypothetical protein BGZ73_003480 [Actinomortierella ambigua]|nr:hypothetical protein BGZ73_003480 [Actinomortierella ambigua]
MARRVSGHKPHHDPSIITTINTTTPSSGSTTTLTQSERATIDLEAKTVRGSEQEIQRGNTIIPAVNDLSGSSELSRQEPASTAPSTTRSKLQHHSNPYSGFKALLKSLEQQTTSAKKKGRRWKHSGIKEAVQHGHQHSVQSTFTQSPALHYEEIERLWQEYTHLTLYGGGSSGESYSSPRLSLREYEQLMDVVRVHPTSQTQGSICERRVLQLYDDARSIGLIPTARMYYWTLDAAFETMNTPETIKAIHDDFVQLHSHRRAATAATLSKEVWKREHELMLTAIVGGFAKKGMVLQGIGFLDQTVHYEDPDVVQALYGQLIQTHFAPQDYDPNHRHHTQALPEDRVNQVRIIEFFRNNESFPYYKIKKLLSQLENSADGSILVKELSSHGLGSLLVQLREQGSLGALLVSLLRQSQVDEAVRLLDGMIDKDIMPPLKVIRTRLVRSMSSHDNGDDLRARQEQVLQAWDDATGRRGLFVAEALNALPDEREIDLEHDPLTPASRARVWTEQPRLQWALQARSTREYETMIESLIRDQELTTAVDAAKYFAHRGWQSEHLDFRQLNSAMINFGSSDQFIQYFHVRYLMGPAARPDLHTFRRFIYAACRRSDLYTALSLFQILKTTHPEWRLDASLYNPIISTASVIPGRMAVAEKMFQAMRQSGVVPDLYTYHALLNGYANAGQLEPAKQIPPMMKQQGLEPTTKTLNLVIKTYLKARNDVSTGRRLLKIMESSKNVEFDQVTINMLLEGHHKAGNEAWLEHFLDKYFAGDTSENARAVTQPGNTEAQSSTTTTSSKSTSGSRGPLPSASWAREHLATLAQQRRKSGGDSRHDYWTMYSALKLALWKTDISAKEVWALWETVNDQIIAPTNLPATHVPFTKVIATDVGDRSGSRSSKSAPESTTPRRKTETRTMSNADYFKYTSLQLFWHAFKKQGDLRGVKMINRQALKLFPDRELQPLYVPSTSCSSSPDSASSSSDPESQPLTSKSTQQPSRSTSNAWKSLAQQMSVHAKLVEAKRLEAHEALKKQTRQRKQNVEYKQRTTKRAAARLERQQRAATRERFGASWGLHDHPKKEGEEEETPRGLVQEDGANGQS